MSEFFRTCFFALLFLISAVPSGPAQSNRESEKARNTRVARNLEGLLRAKIGIVEALKTATARIGGDVRKIEFEVEVSASTTLLVWEVALVREGMKFQIDVNAETGDILDVNYDGALFANADPAQDGVKIPRAGLLALTFSALDKPPPELTPLVTGNSKKPTAWAVVEDVFAPSRPFALSAAGKNPKRVFSLLVADPLVPDDVHLATWIRASSGTEDTGGGIAWRVRDENNYLFARWSPKEGNLRVYAVVNGVRTAPIATASLDADPAAWHTLEVLAKGPRFEIRFDGITQCEGEDKAFASGGQAALWINADATTLFDDFVIAPLR